MKRNIIKTKLAFRKTIKFIKTLPVGAQYALSK